MLCVDPCTLSNNLSKCLFSTEKHVHLTKHDRQNVIPKGQSKMTECNFMILAFLFRFKYGGRFRWEFNLSLRSILLVLKKKGVCTV